MFVRYSRENECTAYDEIVFCVLYMIEKNIVDLELLVVLWESTAAVQIHTFVRWWTCFVRFPQVNVSTDYDETFLFFLYMREIIIVS